MTRPRPLRSALFILIAACGAPDQRNTPVVRDSAGIEIVESLGSRWAADDAWRIENEPELQVGMVEGDAPYLFSSIEGALLLPDAGIAVADRGSSQVRFFGRDGTFDGYVGGSGEGPGEFGYIRGIGRCGADSLFVFEIDYETKVFSPERSFVRQARPFDAATVERRPYALECAPNGYYVAVGWEPRVASGRPATEGPPIGFYRAEAPVWILAPSHAVADGIARIEHAGLVVSGELGTFLSSERIGTERGSRPHPFGRSLRLAMNEDAIYLGTGEQFQIRRYSLQGELGRLIRWDGEDLTINDDDIQAYRESQLEAVEPTQRAALERSLRDMPMPPAFPAYVRLETDAVGNLWVEHFRRPGARDHHWTVFSAEGALLGRVDVPIGLTITDIGDDRIVGVSSDDLGVERVSVHRLIKSDTPNSHDR